MFNTTAAKFIQEFCKPYQKISLINFMHDITFGKNQISMLVSNAEIFSFYLNNKIPMLCTDDTGRVLENGIYINKILEEQYKDCSVLMPLMVKVGQQLGSNFGKNSLHIVKREENCQHFYSLFFDLSEQDFLHWVINNGHFLDDLIANYNNISKDIILEAKHSENRIKLPNFNFNKNNTENSSLNSSLISVLHKDINTPIFLSERQGQCLQLLTQGKSAKEIAIEMKLSPRTIEHYLERIRKLLGCKNNKELIIYYLNQLI
jgi:DNA-binding CsgD family transcriptional regulator